ncbi:ATP-binding protein [Mycolicibacterium xanthum]|uniref:ATP-binding protein n=1 Tax=Mycolicibacterium xanthum TaxID=2796469 RepID=UPI0027E0C749|nr:adenylate/guanylate cyclase domain-containing protein [Mycolicibacterium xanthum]
MSAKAKFCHECAAPVTSTTTPAEYKQVTVLFADVVHSMEIAKTVGAERLREIMAGLVDQAATVVRRCGGTVDKFTGDGIMALFGAPIALEDHALRACRAALAVQGAVGDLADEVGRRDGIDLRLRIGLNSGQVIAGEVGTAATGYTAIGEQVGLAQRMESVAPPGGVMLSSCTARLVEGTAVLGEPERVHIKGSDQPVQARRLLGVPERNDRAAGVVSALVGRRREMAVVRGLLESAMNGLGAVVTVVGSPGVGKSRLVREVAALAAEREVEVLTAYCESHTVDVPFRVVARLLRAAAGVSDLDGQEARDRVRERIPDADPEDLLLFDDLLGIADPEVALPNIDPDARRRRLTALVNTALLARESAAVYAIEDAHWADEVSESILTAFLAVIPHTPSLVLITHRPEYDGALTRVAGAHTIALDALSDTESAALVAGLVGSDPSVTDVATLIVERAAGNPFFAQEIARELAERGVLLGSRGAYVSTADVAEVSVPATVQATIAARIDRLGPAAKRTLCAAAVIGSKFTRDVLDTLGVEPVLDDLVRAQFLDRISSTHEPEYVFHHPLVRTVAYESQLKSHRTQMHRRLAAAIETRDLESADQNAALIAEHLAAAADWHAAYSWHMRAATWAASREIGAARASWQRAGDIADRLAEGTPDRLALRIAPRAMLCGTAYRLGGVIDETGFDELRTLCAAAGDHISLAMGLSGFLVSRTLNRRLRELAAPIDEYTHLLESIGDPDLIVGLMNTAGHPKLQAGEIAEALRLAERVVEMADGDTTKGNFFFESPLAWGMTLRGVARCSLGDPRWRGDLEAGLVMARAVGGITQFSVTTAGYAVPVLNRALLPDAIIDRDTCVALQNAERFGDDLSLAWARIARGMILTRQLDAEQDVGVTILESGQQQARRHGDLLTAGIADIAAAEHKHRIGDIDGAIERARVVRSDLFASGEMLYRGPATTVLVESLLGRGTETDLREAQDVVDQLAAVPTQPGFVLHELPLRRLRALLARAHGDEAGYRSYRDRYRDMATALGFEGHMKLAEDM